MSSWDTEEILISRSLVLGADGSLVSFDLSIVDGIYVKLLGY